VIENRKPLLTNDAAHDPRAGGVPPGHVAIERFLSAPALVGDTLVGQVAVANAERDYTDRDLEALDRLAGLYAIAVQHRRDEDALRKSEEQYRVLVQSANSIILRLDTGGRLTFINEFGQKFFGFSEEEVIGKPVVGTIVPEKESSGRDLGAMFEEVLRNPDKYANNENENIRKNGERAWIVWTNRGIVDETGQLIEILCIGNDITDRKRAEVERERLERQLRQAQKMEALGTLAGGIAHDFNNILSAIMGFAELALLDVEKPSPLRENLQQVFKSSHRARDLVRQILTFSRQSEQERKPFEVGLIVKEALKLLRASLPSTIEVRQKVASSGLMEGDPTQIHQVLMNLCTNAAHAMRDKGGVLEVSLTEVDLDHDARGELSGLTPGHYLRLTVGDTGHGIEPGILDQVFDPFFSTKGPGEGTGLGLSVVHGIVRSCGGTVKVYSEVGKGTVFHVLLPLIETAEPVQPPRESPVPRGSERILLVDDEPTLVQLGKQMLEYLGYRVMTQTSSLEALEVFRNLQAGEEFDLVVTDLTIPHLTGIQLALELHRLRPLMPVILCTGFSDLGIAEKARHAGICGILMKPVVMRKMGELVRKVLDEALEKRRLRNRETV